MWYIAVTLGIAIINTYPLKGNVTKIDLDFISGAFFDYSIPKELNYLYNYFKTPMQRGFLSYWYCVGNYRGFQHHTGFRCDLVYKKKMKKKLEKIVATHAQFKSQMNIEVVWQIESGNYKF